MLPRLSGFALPGFPIGSDFSGPASLGRGFTFTLKPTAAGVPLSMSGESVMPSKGAATRARIRLDTAMDLGVPFQVVLAHERASAVDAAVLPIPQVRLNVGFDIFLPPKAAVAIGVCARPSTGKMVGTTDVRCDFFGTDAGIFDGGIDIQVRD